MDVNEDGLITANDPAALDVIAQLAESVAALTTNPSSAADVTVNRLATLTGRIIDARSAPADDRAQVVQDWLEARAAFTRTDH
jgi:hypothetical protein